MGLTTRRLTGPALLACEQGHKPLSVIITAGQRGDSPRFQAVLQNIRVPPLYRSKIRRGV